VNEVFYVVDATVVSWPSESASNWRFAGSLSFVVPSWFDFSSRLVSSSSSGRNLICSRGAKVSESGGYGHWLARRVEGFLTHARPWNTRTLSRNSLGILGVGLQKWNRKIKIRNENFRLPSGWFRPLFRHIWQEFQWCYWYWYTWYWWHWII
jgi:hypothetical protein